MALVADYDSSDDDAASGDDAASRGAIALPSAVQLLDAASGAPPPSFLSQQSSRPEVDYKSIAASLSREREGEADAAEAAESASVPTSTAGHKRPREEGAAAPPPPAAPAAGGAKPATKTPAEVAAAKAAEAKKTAFKDRAKHQRLSGQSGIGSDFRTWRTDEEMALRQQFDG